MSQRPTYLERLKESVSSGIEYCRKKNLRVTVRRIRKIIGVDPKDKSAIVFISRCLDEFRADGVLTKVEDHPKVYTF